MTVGADGARAVRDEDAFDVDAVAAWLREQVPDLTGVPEVRQFAGGASNLTYLLRYPDRELVLRRPPAGAKPTSGHDMAREYRVQQLLAPVYPYVPTMVALCTDHAVLGSDFYVMGRVPGTVLRSRPPASTRLDAGRTRTLCTRVVDLLVELHRVDPVATGLDSLGRGPGYIGRQVAGWSKRYHAARTRNVPSFERVMAWLAANQPDDLAGRVIHGDFRLDNVVLGDDLAPKAVLDWELATVGDPLMDLGSALAYWVQADDDRVFKLTGRQPTYLPGMLRREEVVAHYADRTGTPIADWAFYEVFGLFRLAVIAQQIYYRYHHRQTRNPAFRHYWIMVGYLDYRSRRLIRAAERKGR
ncbi:MAG TPA: phosphotransferase family protein [Planosporangium sp.]|nr:phosphotransferase family protein [Planosporangium sp.]